MYVLGDVFNLHETLPENMERDARSKTTRYQKSHWGYKATGKVIWYHLRSHIVNTLGICNVNN